MLRKVESSYQGKMPLRVAGLLFGLDMGTAGAAGDPGDSSIVWQEVTSSKACYRR